MSVPSRSRLTWAAARLEVGVQAGLAFAMEVSSAFAWGSTRADQARGELTLEIP